MNENNRHTSNVTDTIRGVYSVPQSITDKDKDIARYVLEKSLRVASVTLKLTSLLDTQVPLRSVLEKTSLRLIEEASRAQASVSGREGVVGEVRLLVSLFETARLAGVVSESNATLIVRELLELVSVLAEVGWVQVRGYEGAEVFAVEKGSAFYAPESFTSQSSTPKGYQTVPRAVETGTYAGAAKKDVQVGAEPTSVMRPKPHTERVQEIQKDRRATILGLLQRKDRVTVKDVSNVIKDCSEKTIQRELLALVRQGVLVKEGERRWSTYRLA